MTDLTDFLRARLDEDEQVAQAAVIPAHDAPNAYKPHPPLAHWRYTDMGDVEVDYDEPGPYSETWRVTTDSEGSGSVNFDTHGHHIARHDPARVLAEVDVKRRIVNSFAASEEPLTARTPEKAIVRMVLRLLAMPYADHLDYRQEWKP